MLLNFWAGVAILTLSLALSVWVIWHIFATERRKLWSGVAAVLAVYVLTLWMIWTPSSVSIGLLHSDDRFPAGADVYGIEWREGYRLLVLGIKSAAYEAADADVFVATNNQIAKANVISSGNICSAVPINPAGTVLATVNVTLNSTGETKTLTTSHIESSQIYRVHCERLLSDTDVTIAFALTNGPLKWAEVSASFDVGRASRPVVLPPLLKCFSEEKRECMFPLLPNDYRSTFKYHLLADYGLEGAYDSNCPANKCPGWSVFYGLSGGGRVSPPQDRPLGSLR